MANTKKTKKNPNLYVQNKIEHMVRLGLIVLSPKNNGRGPNGGACPDWMKE